MDNGAGKIGGKRAARVLLLYGVPLVAYCTLALKLGLANREVMNGDTVAYVRRAQYLLWGDFYHFISDHFSLMLSWLIAPLLAAGIDGLYAARIVTGCIGAAHLMLVIKLSERLLCVHWIWRMLAGLALAPFLAFVAIRAITPDHLLAAWLVGYFIIVLNPALARSRRWQFAAGIVGGLAYLAKAFALPFVLVHLPLTLLMQMRRAAAEENQAADPDGNRGLIRRVLPAYTIGLAGFFLVALPWIGAISWKVHHLSAGSAGAAAHGITAYELADWPKLSGLLGPQPSDVIVPPGPYISAAENPEMYFPHWSAFDSWGNFKFQLRISAAHALALVEFISKGAPLYLFVIFPVLALLTLAIRSQQRWKMLWLLCTIGLFMGPFLLVVIQARYLNPQVVPLLILLCLILLLEWRPRKDSDNQAGQRVRWWRAAIALAVLGAFTWGTMQWLRPIMNHRPSRIYRQFAQRIFDEGLQGPFAGDSSMRALQVCFHTGHKMIQFSPSSDPDYVEGRLREAGVRYLLVWDTQRGQEKANCGALIAQDPAWREVFRERGGTVYRFDPAHGASTRPATSRPIKTVGRTRPAPSDDLEPPE